MIRRNTKGFSFVELVITLSILTLLAVIGYNANHAYQERSANTKVIAHLETLNNALEAYKTEKDILPLPGGNKNYFTQDGKYAHSENSSFGVYGVISDTTIPKKFLSMFIADPITKSNYGYGKTKTGNEFEVAGVIRSEHKNTAYVKGNYTAEQGLYNLIREYNGPDYVTHKGEHLPYNPEEKLFIATVYNASGDVVINGRRDNIVGTEVGIGSTIFVPQNGSVELYFSDGSRSLIGSNTSDTEVTLSDMDFISGFKLSTKVKLFLAKGDIWTKAASLQEGSHFEIGTIDSTAAVRGTIFGVQKSNQTNTIVQVGNIALLAGETQQEFANIQVPEGAAPKGVSTEDGNKTGDISSPTIPELNFSEYEDPRSDEAVAFIQQEQTSTAPEETTPEPSAAEENTPEPANQDTDEDQETTPEPEEEETTPEVVNCNAGTIEGFGYSELPSDTTKKLTNYLANGKQVISIKCNNGDVSIIAQKSTECNNGYIVQGDSCVSRMEGCSNADITIGGITFASCDITDTTNGGTKKNGATYYTWEQARSACPTGYKLPSKTDWQTAINSGEIGEIGLNSKGFLLSNGDLRGTYQSYYWSSTEKEKRTESYYLRDKSNVGVTAEKTNHMLVRCIK